MKGTLLAVSSSAGLVVAGAITPAGRAALLLFACGLLGLGALALVLFARVLFTTRDQPATRLDNLLKTALGRSETNAPRPRKAQRARHRRRPSIGK